MKTISIITCAYNPDARILSRTFRAVEQLTVPSGVTVEYIVVDNNSNPALAARPEFAAFLARNATWVRLVAEPNPGLTPARLRGLQESTGSLIVFFDDDNEPEADYLEQVVALRRAQPDVAIWSPGNVWVEFIGEADPWTQKNALEKLQELHLAERKWSTDVLHFEHLPYGTGMVVERPVLEAYAQKVAAGTYTASDRKGSALTSSGDIQIVYTAAALGRAVGRAPELKLRHLIAETKSTFDYIKRLYYGCSIEGFAVTAQSFPEAPLPKVQPLTDTLRFGLYNSWYLFKMGVVNRNFRQWQCQTAGMLADAEGKYRFYGKRLPFYMRMLKNYLRL